MAGKTVKFKSGLGDVFYTYEATLPPMAVTKPAYQIHLSDLCKCTHTYGDHSNGLTGPCQYGWPSKKSVCKCVHFVDVRADTGVEEEWE